MSTDTTCNELPEPSMGSFQPYDQFILFGDSITQGSHNQDLGFAFAPALQNDYIRRLDVINRGFSGYTSAQALKALPRFFPTPDRANVRAMTIFFGANDAVLPGGVQYIPVEDYKRNLKAIIQHPAVKEQNLTVFLLTPPPINEYQTEVMDHGHGHDRLQRTASNTKVYADACREVGAELGVIVVDIWRAFMTFVGWEEGKPLDGSKDVPENAALAKLFSDGLHFKPGGYRIVYNELLRVIRKDCPDLAPENIEMILPDWVVAPQ
ncbi:hypothetical protein FQN54_000748 [Arachnomyces sp. PD_36]|nr:hypothetical protein FQN54_000748 [Arachnomyces sp. PD_36]